VVRIYKLTHEEEIEEEQLTQKTIKRALNSPS